MGRWKTFLAVIVLMAGSKLAWGLSLEARVDKSEGTLADQIMLTLTLEGTERAAQPQLPPLPAFEVIPRGNTTRMQIINGQVTSGVDYNYILIPKKTGVFVIGPATVSAGGQTIPSNTVTLTITAGEVQAGPARDLFITTSISNQAPYVNEQIIYTFKLFRSIRIANANLESPSFEGFRVESLGKEKEYETIINGKSFLVTEIRQALFPVREGSLGIPPAKLSCDVVMQSRRRGFFNDPFFDDSLFGFSRTEPKVLRSNPITLEVRPLPSEGKTSLFSGLVGNFSISTGISKKQLEVGDTATLTITVKGSGNIRDAAVPSLPPAGDFKIYDDKPVLSLLEGADRFGGTLTVKKALVPLREGSLRVPELAFTFFDPARGTYELSKSQPLVIDVSPPSTKEKLHLVEALGTTTSKEEIKIIGKDILPIMTSPTALKPHPMEPWHWLYLACFSFPLLGYAGTVLMKKRKQRLEEDTGYVRSRSALKSFNQKTPLLKKQMRTDDSNEFYRLTSRILKEFLGDKLNITGSALTPQDIEHQLLAHTIPQEKIEELKGVLHILEAGQFALQRHPASEKEKLLHQTRKLVRWLDKRIRQTS